MRRKPKQFSARRDVFVRWLIGHDYPAVLEIERASFPDPWDEPELRDVTRRQNVIAMVAERGSDVLGFMVHRLHERRIDLVTLAVHPRHRRKGVGSALLGKLLEKLSPQRRRRLVADVPDSPDFLPAHLWLRANGLRAERVLRGWFGDADSYRFVARAGG